MDAVVVGGGIVGLASAYYLADRGAEVTLCEKSSLGGESTQRSFGGIRTQFSTRVNVDLSLSSLEVWDDFEGIFGVDIAHRRPGYLFLAREGETAAAFERQIELQNERGADSRYLEPEEACEYCPGLHPEEFVAATYSPLDGFADPNLAAQGYAQLLTDVGVNVRTQTSVTDVTVEGKSVTGVETEDGRIEADFVVNAAGAWAARIASMADVSLPIVPKRRQVVVTDPERMVPEDIPLTIDLDGSSYFRPEREGTALVGGHRPDTFDPAQDPDTYDRDVDLDWAAETLERTGRWADYFGPDSRIRRGWAGLYAATPDHHPIIEETIPGFVTAAGFSGHGFMHAPATGQLAAELVLNGEPSLVDIDRLTSDRFEDDEIVDEHNVV